MVEGTVLYVIPRGLGDPEYGVPAAFIDSAVVVEQGQFHP
jgi:hypothetical protein